MEKTLEKGEDKIQKICDALRKEALEPARKDAEQIVENAKAKAEQIIGDAHKKSESLIQEARAGIEKERNVFHSSLEQASKQALGELRQEIEHNFFSDELQKVVRESTSHPQTVAKLIEAIVTAIDKEGIAAELSAVIPRTVSTKEVAALLGEGVLKRLEEKGVELGEFFGGAQVRLRDKKMTIDITDQSLMELLSNYVRKDFRKLLFKG